MKKLFYAVGGIALVGALWFAYYAISPLFINIKVDEALPNTEMQDEHAADVPRPTVATTAVVVGTTGHPASGTVRVVEVEGTTYVRYEDFKIINGPDIYVYLAKDLDATEFVDLGRVRATEGNINYEIPVGVDITEYRYVLTWCKQFGVLFNYADLGTL